MEFFKRFKPDTKKKNEKDEGIFIPNEKIIPDLQEIGLGKKEESLDDYVPTINKEIDVKRIIGKDGTFLEEYSEKDFNDNATLQELKELYAHEKQLKDDIGSLSAELNRIESQLDNMESRSRRLSLKLLTRKAPKEVLEQSRRSDESEDGLKNHLSKIKFELRLKSDELQDLNDIIRAKENLYDGGTQHYDSFIN